MIFSQTLCIVVSLLIPTVSKMSSFHNNFHTTERGFDFSRLRRETVYHYRKFEESLIHIQKLKNQKWFMRECLAEQVIPKSIKPTLTQDTTPFHLVYKLTLEDRLSNIKVQIEEAYYYSRRFYYNLRYFASRNLLRRLVSNAHSFKWRVSSEHLHILKNKLSRLFRETGWKKFTN